MHVHTCTDCEYCLNCTFVHFLAEVKMLAPKFRWRRSRWASFCPVELTKGNMVKGKAEFVVGYVTSDMHVHVRIQYLYTCIIIHVQYISLYMYQCLVSCRLHVHVHVLINVGTKYLNITHSCTRGVTS